MKIQVCTGKACKGRFSEYILQRLENDKKFYDLKKIEVGTCPCTGNCKLGPNVIFDKTTENYMNPAKASKIMVDRIKK